MIRRAPADSFDALFLRPIAWQWAVVGFFVVCIVGQSALANVTPHREYLFEGDLSDTSGADDENLTPVGSPSFVAGNGGGMAVQFDGAADALIGAPVFPDDPGNDTGGAQMYVRVDNDGPFGVTRQDFGFNTILLGGPSITAAGDWHMSADGHDSDDQIASSVAVVPGATWYHVMQHFHKSGADGAPDYISGSTGFGSSTEGDGGFTSVIYVNGLAVAANNDVYVYSGSTASNNPTANGRSGAMVLGATEVADSNDTLLSFDSFFKGAIDDLKIYSVDFDANDTFNLLEDNDYIADQIFAMASITADMLPMGDITIDGDVDQDDIDAFVDGWLFSKKLQGAHNEVYVGDWETYQKGDINLDGQVNLEDAYLLHLGLSAAATGSASGSAVPEPATLATFLLGVIGLAAGGMRRRRG